MRCGIYCQALLLPTFQSSQLLLSATISLTEGSDCIDQVVFRVQWELANDT